MLNIYLANLTHAKDGVYASQYVPLNLGCLAAYARKSFGNKVDLRLFNLPSELEEALATTTPDVLAVSNYSWNFQLNYFYLRHYKKRNQSLITIMGGPNYPGKKNEQELFLKKYPSIDYYVFLEGEKSFAGLIGKIIDGNLESLTEQGGVIAGCHYIRNGAFVDGGPGARIYDLDEIPSPYLEGYMDNFLAAGFEPMLQTNRGCPFSCAYCHSGNRYYTKLPKFSLARVFAEIEYLGGHVKSSLLSVADDNFGIFSDNKRIAEKISEVKRKTGWPVGINISTSKINKQQVIDCIRPLGRALPFSISVQSMTAETLEAINRKNLSFEEMQSVMSTLDCEQTYSLTELIMPLPNETVRSYLDGTKKIIDSHIDSICSYTAMLLPNTPLFEDEYYEQFKLTKKFRVIPRDFGEYLGEKVIETEMVCVATSTMTIEEYYWLRGFHFVVNNYYNLKLFSEVISYLWQQNVSVFQWLENIHKAIANDNGRAGLIYNDFVTRTKEELWDSEEELRAYYEDNYDNLLDGKEGANLIMQYSGYVINNLSEFARVGKVAVIESDPPIDKRVIDNLFRYCLAVKGDIFNESKYKITEHFDYDIVGWMKSGDHIERFRKKVTCTFVMSEKQQQLLKHYGKRFGNGEHAQGLVLNRIGVENVFRSIQDA